MKGRASAGLVAALITLGVAACQGTSDIEALDQRVVNGVVQRPGGDGYADQQWVAEMLRARILPDTNECLSERGRADIDADRYLKGLDATHYSALPSPEWYRVEGVMPDVYRIGLTEEESHEEQLVIECREVALEEGEGSVHALAAGVETEWFIAFDEFLTGETFLDEFAEFEACLQESAGYPGTELDPGSEPDVYGFPGWWSAQHGGEDMSDSDNLEGGQIFADCLEPYTEAQAVASDDVRDAFILDHAGDLKKISDALTG